MMINEVVQYHEQRCLDDLDDIDDLHFDKFGMPLPEAKQETGWSRTG